MDNSSTNRGASLRAYPNLSEAAAILDVSTSTLSRRKDLNTSRRGDRDRVLSAAEVLRLATIYRKRALNDVAQDLLDRGAAEGVDERRDLEAEVEAFFEDREVRAEGIEAFIETARRLLPPLLFEEVKGTVRTEVEAPPGQIIGYQQPEEN
jgi:hypothetical protein